MVSQHHSLINDLNFNNRRDDWLLIILDLFSLRADLFMNDWSGSLLNGLIRWVGLRGVCSDGDGVAQGLGGEA
jgi:hypothetical protein